MRAPRVLIIENDFLIGEMLHDMVAELGYSVTKVAHGLPSALNEISKENFDGVLVNIGIDDQKHGNDIADILLEKKIPFAFVTGYGHAFEERHAHACRKVNDDARIHPELFAFFNRAAIGSLPPVGEFHDNTK